MTNVIPQLHVLHYILTDVRKCSFAENKEMECCQFDLKICVFVWIRYIRKEKSVWTVHHSWV